jgi:transposase
MSINYQSVQKRKSYYIPLCAAGKITERKCAKILGMHYVSVHDLKVRYKKYGESVFINGHKGLQYQTKKYSDDLRSRIVYLYRTQWTDAPFATFHDGLKKYHDIVMPYNAVRLILKEAGYKPPRTWSTAEKLAHKPRDERARSGELVQMDASCHDWLMDGSYITLHGGIDDATHTVTGLYFCQNECRLGYNEVLRQTWTRYGIPQSYYIDRHSSFVASKRKRGRTLTERLELSKNEQTHFIDLCNELTIEVILALSPQGKGRIERLWQTLQGRLPYIFRFLGINTIDKANDFIVSWLDAFNKRFAIAPKDMTPAWRELPQGFDMDYKLSLKFSCHTDSMGYFTFHDCDFRLCAPLRAFKKFELCLSEQFGIKAYMDGAYYPVELAEGIIQDTITDKMPIVEKELISRYLSASLREGIA